ncbi:hypothetical protein ABKN59_010869, partial [Abortiporus biennis]
LLNLSNTTTQFIFVSVFFFKVTKYGFRRPCQGVHALC